MGKLSGIDFDVVIERSQNLLKAKAKDLRVVSFLSFALLKADKWEEFADIFEGMETLLDTGFDAVHPERPAAKTNAFKWLAEDRYNDLLAQKKPEPQAYEHYVRAADSLTKIKTILEGKYPEGSPFPTNLFKVIQQFRDQTKPKPVPVAPVASAVASGVPGAATGSQSAATPEVLDSPKAAQTSIRAAARFLLEKEDAKPMGYRIIRAVRWDLLEKSPPAESGKTQLNGPNPQQRTFFANLSAQTDFKTLLTKSEEAFVGGGNHLWLDLQRFSALACTSLGDTYKAVHMAIVQETALLLKRVPELVSLSFSDGGALCDPATLDWIESDVKPAFGSSTGGDGGSGVIRVKSVLDEEMKEINAQVAANKTDAAIETLQKAIRSSSCEEDNFKRTIIMGDLLLKAKQPDIAVAVLEALDSKIGAYHLDTWNPDLAADAWVKLGHAYKAARINKQPPALVSINEKFTQIVRLLSQINPKRAWELNG